MNQAVTVPLDVRLMNISAAALTGAFAALMLTSVCAWAWNHPAFSLTGISVRGDVAHNNALTLRANVAPRLRGTFFNLDLAQAQSAFEALPWVRKATVQREFPNRLKVSLQEHQAVAYWGVAGESRLLNSFAEVFDANVGELEQEALPHLNGPPEQTQAVLAMYHALQPGFAALDLVLDELQLSARGSWLATLDTGAELELGSGGVPELLARTHDFIKTLTQVTARYGRKPEALESADLRHEQGYAIRLRGVSIVAAEALAVKPQ